ncbi:hypothetical protein DYB25_003643 [Aphanomyces astaci]|uniref:peptidylprolyl isomerase n=1 Tax=Aphanomyces astaci TaxID=112090 RepID=A0A396ZT77_APHAT|nr:hypothetical protein DYB25_003643 [Aphanomyces astaci]
MARKKSANKVAAAAKEGGAQTTTEAKPSPTKEAKPSTEVNPSPAKKAQSVTKLAIEPGFFGEQIHPRHSLVCENPTEDMAFQLSGAALAGDAVAGRTTLYVSTERRDLKIALCTLDTASTAQWALNNTFTPMDGALTFSTEGVNSVHLTAYVDAEMDGDVSDDDEGLYGLGPDDDDSDDNDLLDVEDEEDDDEVQDSGRFEEIVEEDKKFAAKKDAQAAGKKRPLEGASAVAEDSKKAKPATIRKAGGVTVEEVYGKEATKGRKVQILYKGKLAKNGKQFDANQNRKSPFGFKLGAGDVIKGMDIGVEGMRVGGKRTVTIPSKLGYGTEGAGKDIPPNSDLIFELELVNA